jgi:hypothetical protein
MMNEDEEWKEETRRRREGDSGGGVGRFKVTIRQRQRLTAGVA